MARRLLAAISNTLASQWDDKPRHFHGGANGPYVCDDPRCVSPSLDPEHSS